MTWPPVDPIFVRGFEAGWEAALSYMLGNWPEFMGDALEDGPSPFGDAMAARAGYVDVFQNGPPR